MRFRMRANADVRERSLYREEMTSSADDVSAIANPDYRRGMANQVSAFCARCGSTTDHQAASDGTIHCLRCVGDNVPGITAPPTAATAAPPTVAEQRKQREAKHQQRVLIATAIFVAVLVVAAGFVHVIYGGRRGLTFCAKESWTLGDTFIDADDAGRTALQDARVMRALVRCMENE